MKPIEEHCPFDCEQATADLGRSLGALGDAGDREARLFARYLRALALLSECAPYVDDPDYAAAIDSVLSDASSNYPFDWHRADQRPAITPRAR